MLLVTANSLAADISNPRSLMFVGDRSENRIDVISLKDHEVVHHIETSIHPDHIVAAPFAPILIYTDTAAKKVVFYDLENQRESKLLNLPMTPRHVVLDTTGSKIGISDDVDGGFVLIHVYGKTIDISLKDFPPTSDVLFDPNDIDIYYSNQDTGAIGLLDTNTQEIYEISITDGPDQILTPPSRSLDGRYIYVGNTTTGEVYSLNAYSRVVFNTFEIGGTPARPYTSPEGVFLYLMDPDTGRLVMIEQQSFTEFTDPKFEHGVNLVAVGRFDRLNLFLSSSNPHWYIFDNVKKAIVASGKFDATPIGALGSADGKIAYVAFDTSAKVALVNLEKQSFEYVDATNNGSGAFTVGLSNNVCH
jgi:DNA-binding beta-propeller fold protein YncE